jgi:hypothetical protein
MNKLLLTTLSLSIPFSLLAQTNEGGLRIEKAFLGVKFYEGTRLLKPNEVLNIMKVDEEAFAEFKKAKSNYDAAQVFGFIGGFMIGWPLGTALAGGDPQWGLAAGGAGVLLLSIPFNSAFVKHSKRAIEIYNRAPGSAGAWPAAVDILPYGPGVKLILRF